MFEINYLSEIWLILTILNQDKFTQNKIKVKKLK